MLAIFNLSKNTFALIIIYGVILCFPLYFTCQFEVSKKFYRVFTRLFMIGFAFITYGVVGTLGTTTESLITQLEDKYANMPSTYSATIYNVDGGYLCENANNDYVWVKNDNGEFVKYYIEGYNKDYEKFYNNYSVKEISGDKDPYIEIVGIGKNETLKCTVYLPIC